MYVPSYQCQSPPPTPWVDSAVGMKWEFDWNLIEEGAPTMMYLKLTNVK